jgi:hypothetical protein
VISAIAGKGVFCSAVTGSAAEKSALPASVAGVIYNTNEPDFAIVLTNSHVCSVRVWKETPQLTFYHSCPGISLANTVERPTILAALRFRASMWPAR